ncbi:MAG: hypothetical protein GEU82_01435 [Luteitalea sp.]|nr:hypothetical protein [Luteitalea sp.]
MITLVSGVSCMTRRLHDWRQEDYNAFKFMRAVARRRFTGSAWIPVPGRLPQRLTNATRDEVVEWFGEMVWPSVQEIVGRRSPVYVPIPGRDRVVGSLPSASRALAAELARRSDGRLLDVLRWRQPLHTVPRLVGPLDPQALSDNLVNTGGVVMADCVLVADVVDGLASVQATAGRLRRLGGRPLLAITAGRIVNIFPDDPFGERIEQVEHFEPRDF